MRVRIGIAGITLALATVACNGKSDPVLDVMEVHPVEVEAQVASLTEIPRTTRATGSAEPWKRVSPGTKILGRIESVEVHEGDRVRSGQLLARLESRDLEAAVAQAQAAVTMAQASLDNTRAQYQRMVDLNERGSVTDKTLEDATAGFRIAEATVEQARANRVAAEVHRSYAEIRSPISGWVVAKHAEAGDMATPGRILFAVDDLSRVKIHVQVPENDVVGLSEGDPAWVGIDVLEYELAATVGRIVPAGDPVSRTFSVRLSLENPGERIKSGMFARVRFERGSRQALMVPRTAVVRRGQLEGLFVVEPSRGQGTAARSMARLRWLKLGQPWNGSVEVLSGLEAGEEIVVVPPPPLSDGMIVTVVSP